MSENDCPVACDLTVLTDKDRARQSLLAESLKTAVVGVRELTDGYEVTLDPQSDIVARLRDFVAIEKQCCPFLEFSLSSSERGTVVGITGPEGTKAFLETEYGLAG